MNSAREALTVRRTRALLAAGYEALEERKQEINDLNVYPVPDGDTGTNLALTVRSIVDSVSALPEDMSTADLCKAISQAALMGARGNSGVILSQIIRGAMEVLGRCDVVDARAVGAALRHATDTAYRAVRKPVEGTILTVLREMAEAASEAETSSALDELVERAVDAGWQSVQRTPTLLSILADAGVVDAGGYGLVVLIEGAARAGEHWETPISTHVEAAGADLGLFPKGTEEEESEYTYCTSFLLAGRDLDKGALERRLSRLGDSLLVVGDSERIKIHIHTDEPGEVLALGTSMGTLSAIEIDNMREQTAARRQRLAEASALASQHVSVLTQPVAVVAGEGNKALFRNLGVDFIVEGGQSMNPSAQDLMIAVERATAPSVIILPNNANVIMTADQTVKLANRKVYVVPARSMQAGLSAAVAFESRKPGEENVRGMKAALENVATGEITRAVRDSLVDGVNVKTQDFIGLVDDRVVASSPDLAAVVAQVAARLLSGGREIMTALVGEGEEASQAAGALEVVRAAHPEVEIELHEGGQPYYPLLLSAE
ncbi:MAG: DAK2 domain-containing protein [Actinobacteria bacterium]|nr:DAK2 domain-containing protein [Actinomycetota bacterium]